MDISIWQPIPPNGYSSMGDIVVPSLSPPTRSRVICIPNKYLSRNGQFKKIIYQNSFSPDNTISIWNIGNYGAFMANHANTKPIVRQDDIKDLTQELLNKKNMTQKKNKMVFALYYQQNQIMFQEKMLNNL